MADYYETFAADYDWPFDDDAGRVGDHAFWHRVDNIFCSCNHTSLAWHGYMV